MAKHPTRELIEAAKALNGFELLAKWTVDRAGDDFPGTVRRFKAALAALDAAPLPAGTIESVRIDPEKLVNARFGLAFEACARPGRNIEDAITFLDGLAAQIGITPEEMMDPPRGPVLGGPDDG